VPIVFTSRVFSVEVDRVRLPNGTEHDVALVRHAPSVVLLPMDGQGRVILIRQYRPSIGRDMWELPAGGVNPGESAEEAARRECEEEIGLVPGSLIRLGAYFPAPGFCDEQLVFFRASDLRPPDPSSTRHADPDEDIHPQSFTFDEARAMVADGLIIDLKTAYGLTLL
jgi:ADP-ribose pyrophosphatase